MAEPPWLPGDHTPYGTPPGAPDRIGSATLPCPTDLPRAIAPHQTPMGTYYTDRTLTVGAQVSLLMSLCRFNPLPSRRPVGPTPRHCNGKNKR